MRPRGSPQELEARRRMAMDLAHKGWSLNRIARTLGVYASSVMRWRDAMESKGVDGLRAKPVPGRPRRMSQAQCRRLIQILSRGAMARGYANELWTTQRIADVIHQEFGVRYDRDYVGVLMHQLQWSHQKPERRALERDEQKIEHWKRSQWPRIKKGLSGWEPTSCS